MVKTTPKFIHFLLHYHVVIAILSITIVAFTWYLDLAHLVHACPYCRTERITIGILSIFALIPKEDLAYIRYLSYAIAYFGATTAVNQMFISIKEGIFPTLNFSLALCAYVLIGILCLIIHYKFQKK